MKCSEIPKFFSPTTTASPISLLVVGASVTATPMSASPVTQRTRIVAASVFANTEPPEIIVRLVFPITGTEDGRELHPKMPILVSVS